MSDQPEQDVAAYVRAAESWANDREAHHRSMLRIAWIAAGVATVIALAEAVAIVALTPLKTVVPYTLLVDRQTGYVQALKPLDQEIVAPDRALTQSLLAQYIIAREGFDIDSLNEDYRKVALWSAGGARDRYVTGIQASNPASPLVTMPRRAIVEVEVRGISSLGPQTSLVRFVTLRTDPGGRRQEARPWQAVVSYRFSAAGMSAADRLVNPLGFQVVRYRRDAEIAPQASPNPPRRPRSVPATVAAPTAPGGAPPRQPEAATAVPGGDL